VSSLVFPIDLQGIAQRARQIPSPNCDARPTGERISLAVIHNISLPPHVFGGDDIIHLFTNQLDCTHRAEYNHLEGLRVSSHFLIRRNGELIQFVPCSMRAWHAGVSHWQGRAGCNDFSIGIELEGCDTQPFENAQYEVLIALANSLYSVYPLTSWVGHEQIAPGRKTDPGLFFDWQRLQNAVPDCPRA
jgi:AmpD protein